ncbi:hypothetical protein Pth03_32320 [Planotetraspora thailandica]|uniref:DoxX family protein n=1 Tax=Planotetraspora thailandica TaxID=487172 RepID=A0A8J3XYR0_9ACTN|nr:DoxX family protein [Planotetraspora thailandica]GII54843.1 hypothetical protein Pth03_32320 [Planotetraspora thailandica]
MKRTLHDLASLAARMGVGGIFFANGWHKLEAGLDATGVQFTTLGAPVPELWAAATMLIELVGGALLIAGLAVPAIGLLLFAEALAVFILTAGDTGLPLTGGSVELIVALGAASVLLAVVGAGRISVDHMVVIKRREAEVAEEFAADAEADAVIASLRGPGPTAVAKAAGSPSMKTDAGSSVADPGTAAKPAAEAADKTATGQTAAGDAAQGRTAAGGTGTGGTAASGSAASGSAGKPRSRRPKRPDETTESHSESPSVSA